MLLGHGRCTRPGRKQGGMHAGLDIPERSILQHHAYGRRAAGDGRSGAEGGDGQGCCRMRHEPELLYRCRRARGSAVPPERAAGGILPRDAVRRQRNERGVEFRRETRRGALAARCAGRLLAILAAHARDACAMYIRSRCARGAERPYADTGSYPRVADSGPP